MIAIVLLLIIFAAEVSITYFWQYPFARRITGGA